MVKSGIGAVVWLGIAVRGGATGEMGVLNCASKEVLVGDGTDATVDVKTSTLV